MGIGRIEGERVDRPWGQVHVPPVNRQKEPGSHEVDKDSGIKFGVFDGFTWIRCEGKGSFLESPAMKECAAQRREAGEKHFVIDLEQCSGMDSTFMGFLAGLANQVEPDDGRVEVASPGDRNRGSLEDLGLDLLVDIDPGETVWTGREDEIRRKLEPYVPKRLPGLDERARQVLEAHRQLASTSEENARRFAGVLQVLEEQAPDPPASDG